MKVVRTKLRNLAIIIHDFYKNKTPGVVDFKDLPESTQKINYGMIYILPEKLNLLSYKIVKKDEDGEAITKFDNDENDVEFLAKANHNYWYQCRVDDDWELGDTTDFVKKTSPFLRRWEDPKFSKKKKEINMETIRSYPKIFDNLGYKIVSTKEK